MKKQILQNQIIIKTETFFESVMSDIASFVILGAFFWFNYKFIGGSYFVNFLILVVILAKLISTFKTSKIVTIYRNISEEQINEVKRLLDK